MKWKKDYFTAVPAITYFLLIDYQIGVRTVEKMYWMLIQLSGLQMKWR